MNKYVPFKINFDNAKKANRIGTILLYISTALMVAVFVFSKIPIVNSKLLDWINILNSIIILVLVLIYIIVDYIHFNAETYRRNDLIDNSFNSLLSEDRTQEYYTNDNLQSGIYKMGVNNFESCFFSYRIAKKSLVNSWIKSGIISFIFIFVAISGYNEILFLIIQLAIPMSLITQSIKNQLFVSRLERIFSGYRTLFDNYRKSKTHKKYDALIIRSVLNYETIISWYNTLLDEKVYNKMNAKLSEEWDTIKKQYSII